MGLLSHRSKHVHGGRAAVGSETTYIAPLPSTDVMEQTSYYGAPGREVRFAADSPVEEKGFELLVPLSKRTAVRRTRPFFFGARLHRLRSFLISENDDFELPASQSNLPRRAT
jgi:hypothetical protein